MPRSFANAQEHDPVNDALNGKIQFALSEFFISQGEVLGQFLAPVFNFQKERRINFGGAAPAPVAFCKLIEAAFEDCLARKNRSNVVPLFRVIFKVTVKEAPLGRGVVPERFDAAIVDGEFLEIAEDAQGQLRGPGVAAQLKCGGDFFFDVDGGLLGFEEEFAGATNPKAVVGRSQPLRRG